MPLQTRAPCGGDGDRSAAPLPPRWPAPFPAPHLLVALAGLATAWALASRRLADGGGTLRPNRTVLRCALRLTAASLAAALAPVHVLALPRLPQWPALQAVQGGIVPLLSTEALVLAALALLLPLPLLQHLWVQLLAVRSALARMRRLALLHASLSLHAAACARFVSGVRLAAQALAPGSLAQLPAPQPVDSCWVVHTWVLVMVGFVLPTAVQAAFALHARRLQELRRTHVSSCTAGSPVGEGSTGTLPMAAQLQAAVNYVCAHKQRSCRGLHSLAAARPQQLRQNLCRRSTKQQRWRAEIASSVSQDGTHPAASEDGGPAAHPPGAPAAPPPAGGAAAAAAAATQPAGRRSRLKEILAFCLPVVLVPLADPIMSLIDTIALGRMADALQLACLGPASLLLMFSNYILFGLSVGTVSLVAERLHRGDAPAAATALSSSLFLAATGGALMGATYLGFGPQLLALTRADPAVLGYAATYLRIRALALPAVVLVQVAQAGLLAQRDSLSPFRVVLATSTVSLLGDLLFIGGLGWGVAGAAWTTVAAQYLGATLLLRALRRSRVPPRLHLPSAAELHALLDTFGVLTVFYVAKNLSYFLLQTTAAQLSALLLAAHQPVWSLWCLVSFTNTPLESAALAFLPAASTPEDRRDTARLLLMLGAASGAIGCAVAVGLPAVAPHLFTSNAALWQPMQSVALQGVLAMLCCGMDVAANGCLLGIKDTAFVARAMVACLLGLAGFLRWARAAVPGLPSVWWGLTVFFALRAVQSVPRAILKLGLLSRGSSGSARPAAAAGTQPMPS